MQNESTKLIRRRAVNRLLETGLLVLAVALGVGAAASGLSLLANTKEFGDSMLALPAYKEIVVSTQSSADEMETALQKKPADENTVLTSADLSAADVVPDIAYAYVSNWTRMDFINEASAARESEMRAQFTNNSGPMFNSIPTTPTDGTNTETTAPITMDFPDGIVPEGGTSTTEMPQLSVSTDVTPDNPLQNGGQFPQMGRDNFRNIVGSDELEKAKSDTSVIISELEDLRGLSVTSGFFQAWGVNPSAGSLFAESDYTGSGGQVILGSKAGTLIMGKETNPDDLVGRKILTREGYQNIVSVLLPTGDEEFDNAFFEPHRSLAQRGFGGFFMGNQNTQLKFTVSDPSKLGSTAELLQNWFDQQYGVDQVVLDNPRAEAQRLIDRNTGISILILFLALAGLFIASVNVSNILMGRGLRMRKSVGILMALGSSKLGILKLFVSEAVILSAFGSVLGALLAIPLASTMQHALGVTTGSWWYVLAGIAASWLLTLGFSVLPAMQNSRISPADAMRVV